MLSHRGITFLTQSKSILNQFCSRERESVCVCVGGGHAHHDETFPNCSLRKASLGGSQSLISMSHVLSCSMHACSIMRCAKRWQNNNLAERTLRLSLIMQFMGCHDNTSLCAQCPCNTHNLHVTYTVVTQWSLTFYSIPILRKLFKFIYIHFCFDAFITLCNPSCWNINRGQQYS